MIPLAILALVGAAWALWRTGTPAPATDIDPLLTAAAEREAAAQAQDAAEARQKVAQEIGVAVAAKAKQRQTEETMKAAAFALAAKQSARAKECGLQSDDIARTTAWIGSRFGPGLDLRVALGLQAAVYPPKVWPWPDFANRTACYYR